MGAANGRAYHIIVVDAAGMVERKKERERKRDRHEGVVAIDWPQEGAREGGQKGSVQGQDQNQTPRRGERCNRETEELARTRTGIWERGGPGFGDCNGLLGGGLGVQKVTKPGAVDSEETTHIL